MNTQAYDVTLNEGMVTSPNPLASDAGRAMLLQGGNAVDAAVATALALCVVCPSSNGIGGYGGCMVIHLAKEHRTIAIDYNTRAPSATREDMFQLLEDDESADVGMFPKVVGNANNTGPLAVGVPGTVAGLALAEERFGRLGWARVIKPAMRLASEGFVVYPGLEANMRGLVENTDPESAAAMFPDGRIPVEGETWVRPDLARLLDVLSSDPRAFYSGEPARMIVDRVRSMGGILTYEDMAAYEADLTEPLSLRYRGFEIHGPSGVTGSPSALETLAILQKLNDQPYSADDSMYWADLADALTLAWTDRLTRLGDVPGMRDVVMEWISDAYATAQAVRVRSGDVPRAEGAVDTGSCTIHLNACDGDLNMVSLTQTHGGGWGSKVCVPGLGIALGHGMSRFDPRPGLPNSPGPGKACLHNMSPFVITSKGEPFGAVGTPGGRMIVSVLAQLTVDLVDFGMTPAQAISLPRIHTEGGVVSVREDMPDFAVEAIRARGHETRNAKGIAGLASAIIRKGKSLMGASEAGPESVLGV